jgi:hypothetical protein
VIYTFFGTNPIFPSSPLRSGGEERNIGFDLIYYLNSKNKINYLLINSKKLSKGDSYFLFSKYTQVDG